ncbi:Chondroitin N-acetylgalactosaminyltransferase [Cordyceps militaris]|uniref:Chondroitin N-acetylgalactosaminyltransferase n=1 Tax=Cordyceps militaris TaxID=73501 RepID=A0A2H4SPB4_CORMI|nr:Chondroitin N-acetylgalactosaminyltransferase [Cordyceps militaris]
MSLLGKPPRHSRSPPAVARGLLGKRVRRTIIIALCALAGFSLLRRSMRPGTSWEKPFIALWPDVNEPYRIVTTSDFRPVSMSPHNKDMQQLCQSFPNHILQSIQPVLKTGYTDDPERMPGQFDGASACFKPGELLIFSDAPANMSGHEVIDILALLPDTYHSFPEFQPYLEQRRMLENGSAEKHPEMLQKINGWKLDRFKFVPAVEQAWLMKPDRDFYVFYESDTYVFWDNLFRFLKTLDPEVPLYMGSSTPGRRDKVHYGTTFANGGPGYVLSRAAVKHLLHRETDRAGRFIGPSFTEKWRYLVNDDEPCGDNILGYILWLSGIEMQALYPMFTQHVFHTLPFDSMRWCSPIFTFHKPSPDQMRGLARWEYGARNNSHPARYADVWDFYKAGSEPRRDNWRNNDVLGRKASASGIKSAEDCEAHCRSLPECLQWTWRGSPTRECFVGEGVFYYGEKCHDSTAGWLPDRITQWKVDHECEDTSWHGPSRTRVYVPG